MTPRFPIEDEALAAAMVRALEKHAEAVARVELAVVRHGLPVVITQALDDVSLPPAARLTMWHLRSRLDYAEYREVYAMSLASEMRIKETTTGQMLSLLVARGYLSEHGKRKPRAFRLPTSRLTARSRAA